jgi:hypothetical protein
MAAFNQQKALAKKLGDDLVQHSQLSASLGREYVNEEARKYLAPFSDICSTIQSQFNRVVQAGDKRELLSRIGTYIVVMGQRDGVVAGFMEAGIDVTTDE